MRFLIHAENFDSLPQSVKEHNHQRFVEILSGRELSGTYAKLAPWQCTAVIEPGSPLCRARPDHGPTGGNVLISVNSLSALIGLLATRRKGSDGRSLTADDVSPVISIVLNELPNRLRNAVISAVPTSLPSR